MGDSCGVVHSYPIGVETSGAVVGRYHLLQKLYSTETPGGEAAVVVHLRPYTRMNEAYKAIEKWMAANKRESAGHSWEIYGDPPPDPATTETTVVHLLK